MDTRLKISILSASNLRKADIGGLSDPYVVCEIPGKPKTKFRTKTVTQNLAPVWNEEFEIPDYHPSDCLEFKIYDEDNVVKRAITGDDYLGGIILEPREFYPDGTYGEFPLAEAGEGHAHAVIRLKIVVEQVPAASSYHASSSARPGYGSGELPPTATMPPGHFNSAYMPQPSTQPSDVFTSGRRPPEPDDALGASRGGRVQRIRVTIVGAKDLRDADWWSGSSDPFCVCEVPGKLHTKFKTDVISKSLNPTWNRSCEMDCAPGDPLKFEVYDKDIWPKPDDFLGMAELPSGKFMPYGFQGDLTLDEGKAGRDGKRRVLPTLQVRVEILGPGGRENAGAASTSFDQNGYGYQASPWQPPPRLAAATGPPQYLGEHRRLKVVVMNAKGMRVADPNRRSDLYCVCEIAGRPTSRFQTRGSSNARDPVWNHEQEIPDYIVGDGLVFTVLDMTASRGGFGGYPSSAASDGLIGTCQLACEQFYPYGFNSPLTICNPGEGIMGLLQVQVVVVDERAGASNMSLVNDWRSNLPRQQASALRADVRHAPALQSSPYVHQVDRPLVSSHVLPSQQRLADSRSRYPASASLSTYHADVPLVRELSRDDLVTRGAGYQPATVSAAPVPLVRELARDDLVTRGAGYYRHGSPSRLGSGYVPSRVDLGMSTRTAVPHAQEVRSSYMIPAQGYPVRETLVVSHSTPYQAYEAPRAVPEVHRSFPSQPRYVDTPSRYVDSLALSHSGLSRSMPRRSASPMRAASPYGAYTLPPGTYM